jgi:hypothetical protein
VTALLSIALRAAERAGSSRERLRNADKLKVAETIAGWAATVRKTGERIGLAPR